MIALRFHHVGVGTTDFEGTIQTYEALGHRLRHRVDDALLNVRVAFMSCPGGGGPWIEVLAPLGDDGPLRALIARKALPSPYHTCYAVELLETATTELRDMGFLPVGQARPALAFENARVAFFYHSAVGLVELVERPPEWPFS
jgi:methylmalonyl-CoA/ethylmalonyl-CoA epimerase